MSSASSNDTASTVTALRQPQRVSTALKDSQNTRRTLNAIYSSASFRDTGSLKSPSVNEKRAVVAQVGTLLPSIVTSNLINCADSIPSTHQDRQSHLMVQKQLSLKMTSVEPLSSLVDDASTLFFGSSDAASQYGTNFKDTKASLITQKTHKTIPSDKINLRLILVSGKTKEFLFNPSDSAGDIAQTVFDNWPEDWTREAVSKAEILRLIYQGRFLHCNVTLGALGLPLGKTTVMHLVPRDNLPEPNSQDQRQKSKGGTGRCCSTNCCIL